MLHCVWAHCCADSPLGGQSNSQVSECGSTDTRVKCLVFGICCWPSGESLYLPYIPHNRPQTSTAKHNKGRDDSRGNKGKTHWFLGKDEERSDTEWSKAEYKGKSKSFCRWWTVLHISVFNPDLTLINTTQIYRHTEHIRGNRLWLPSWLNNHEWLTDNLVWEKSLRNAPVFFFVFFIWQFEPRIGLVSQALEISGLPQSF